MPGNDDEYGAQFWFGYTYLWNDEQTDADLLPAEGLSRSYTIRDPSAPGGTREQTGASPVGRNARSATRWPRNTSWASPRCR